MWFAHWACFVAYNWSLVKIPDFILKTSTIHLWHLLVLSYPAHSTLNTKNVLDGTWTSNLSVNRLQIHKERPQLIKTEDGQVEVTYCVALFLSLCCCWLTEAHVCRPISRQNNPVCRFFRHRMQTFRKHQDIEGWQWWRKWDPSGVLVGQGPSWGFTGHREERYLCIKSKVNSLRWYSGANVVQKPELRRNAGCYRKVKLNTYINCQLIINVTIDWILKTETTSECAGSERQRSVTDLDSTAFSDLYRLKTRAEENTAHSQSVGTRILPEF